jgi:hypothetical protein
LASQAFWRRSARLVVSSWITLWIVITFAWFLLEYLADETRFVRYGLRLLS